MILDARGRAGSDRLLVDFMAATANMFTRILVDEKGEFSYRQADDASLSAPRAEEILVGSRYIVSIPPACPMWSCHTCNAAHTCTCCPIASDVVPPPYLWLFRANSKTAVSKIYPLSSRWVTWIGCRCLC